MIGQIIGAVGGLATTWLETKQETARSAAKVKQAKAEAESEVLKVTATHEAGWEKIMAQNSNNSFKDEAWTIAFLIILLANFIEPLQPMMLRGFENLANCPAWVQGGMYASIAASFGLRTVKGFKK